jgi:hypothetical protein
MFGDDYQLPAMGKPGATRIPIIRTKNTKGHHDMTQNQGALQFINLAEQVMELDQVVHQREDQQHFKGLLERIRLGWLTYQDEHCPHTLILDDDNYTSKEIKDISDKALHLFSKHEPKNAHNEKKLQEAVSEDNPLACIHCIDTSTDSTDAKLINKHLKKVFDMKRTMLCLEAMVEIVKANIEPKWGLYNGAIGPVVDIVYTKERIQTMVIYQR